MKIFKQVFENLYGFKEIKQCINSKLTPVSVSGLSQIHKAQLMLALSNDETMLLIVDEDGHARRICDDINELAGENIAFPFPSREYIITEMEVISREYEYLRLSTLSKIISNECKVVVASIEAVMQFTIPPEFLKLKIKTLEKGSEVDVEDLKKSLVEFGYSRSDKVDGPSQFSIRGSIIDIFPIQSNFPVRIELWGDEIDSISYFDIETQRRNNYINEISITPAKEILYNAENLKVEIEKLSKSIRSKNSVLVKEKFEHDIEKINSNIYIENVDKYINLIYKEPSTIFDYINGIVVLNEYSGILERSKGVIAQYNEDVKILLETGDLCRNLSKHYFDLDYINDVISDKMCIYLSSFMHGLERINFKKLINIQAMQNAPWGGEIRQLIEDLSALSSKGYRTILMAGTDKTLPIIINDLRESGIDISAYNPSKEILEGQVALISGSVSSGYEYPEIKSALITQAKAINSKRKIKKKKKGEEIRSLSDISQGDLVVHTLHGIGKFMGIRKLELEGITKDYITIQYAGKDVLYVPVTQLDMVSRYIGARDESGVKLNKLSSNDWQKTRNNVKRAVKDMASELIALYAKREQTKGFKFSSDDEMMRDFEERFPYIETDDQMQSIEEIKIDMERSRPMDRLLCGDVGFGKTEVAFRAAFKCISDSKQCAILAPTTVLAWQHYQTALKRFEHFPVKIELLSRFRTTKQKNDIVKELKKGKIDIVIGTHRLVQKDVEFKDLGLAIIDEEQRFGVAHKEKFKTNFVGVDMLTLSATPIPRTLNMAMSGIRDMSVLEDPPQDRYPVQTYVIEYNLNIIAQALYKEVKRGGQAYYIHNRVESIVSCASKLQELMPNVKIAYAHGQMTEEVMSETWRKLLDHEIDVLVSTTIIETGIDVPNVNTLIIEDSDRFGLSQLYQLRGRVGRSNRRAFAYFTFKKGKILNEIATKRLEAIKEFTQFGSGFRIALRDLEIRGAGSILGGKQHGHMDAVGYDMYLRLLSEAIAEEKGETQKKAEDCVVDIQIEAHIPEKYIESLSQRIDIYKKIAVIINEEDSRDLIDELIDRYGEPPKAILGLIETALFRNTASICGITEITQRNGNLLFYIKTPSLSQVSNLSDKFKGRVLFNNLSKPYISVRLNEKQKPLELIKEVLEIMKLDNNMVV